MRMRPVHARPGHGGSAKGGNMLPNKRLSQLLGVATPLGLTAPMVADRDPAAGLARAVSTR